MSTSLANAVVFTCDENYMPAALFVASQLALEARGRFDIIVLHVGPVSPAIQAKAPGIRFIPAELGPELLNGQRSERHSAAAFARLLIPQLLPKSYRRVLYLDCDVWIGDRPIAPLFDLDLEGYALGAVRDTREILLTPLEHFTEYKPKLGLAADTPYFNGGVLLIDPARFAAERFGERAIEHIVSGSYVGNLGDQSALNAVVAGRWREFSPIWNWQFATRPQLTREFAPGIVHFIGGSKPWADVRARYPQSYWAEMSAFYEREGFSDFSRPASGRACLRRAVATTLSHIARASYDRRERAIRGFMHDTDFWDASIIAPNEHVRLPHELRTARRGPLTVSHGGRPLREQAAA